MIVGIGVDVVDIDRFSALAARQPRFLSRVLVDSELHHDDGSRRADASLAARFAAKEAVAKALGAPAGLAWHDCVVHTDDSGRPHLHISGTVASRAADLGVNRWHISLTHDGGHAIAYVVAEE